MPLVLRPPGEVEAAPLTDRLGRLGRARRRAFLAAGSLRLVALALALVAAAGLLDAAVHLPGAARAALLVGTLGAVGAAVLRWVAGPAREPVHPLAVAMLVEDRFPRLNDSLASAVDFAEAERAGTSSRFRRVAIRRADNLARRYDLDAVVPAGQVWKAFWLAALALAAAVPLALLDRPRTALALTRLADPFGRHPWPTKTTIELLEPQVTPGRRLLLAKGEPFTVRFAVRGVVPPGAVVSVRLSGGALSEDVLALDTPDGTPPTVEHRLDAARVPRDFEFRVVANDADTGWLRVGVQPAPKLVPLAGRPSPQLRLDYPAYTDLPPAELPDGTGVIDAVAGTRVTFRAAADRRIVAAAFRNQGELAPVQAATAAAPLATTNPLGAVAAQLLADEFTADIPVRISGPDGTLLEAEFAPRLPGLYALRFTDEDGLTGVRLFDFRVFPDPPPVVILERPAPGRDPLAFLPTASLPVYARAEDRPFAVKDLFLEYRVGPDAPLRTVPLADLSAAGPALPALAGSVAADVHLKPVGLDASRVVPIAALRRPDGSPPADGDLIVIRAASTDWDDRTALKEPGRSKEVEIRVLGRASLEADFQKKLAELRPELKRLQAEQQAARERAGEVRQNAADGKPRPEDPGKLAQAEQSQRQVRNRIADPDAGLRAKAEQLRDAARANNLPRSPTVDKVEAVADELGRLADQPLEAAEPLLGAAREEAEKPKPDPKKLADLLGKANKQQRAAEDGLANLLERLEEWGGAADVGGEARRIREQVARAGEQAKRVPVPPARDAAQLKPDERAALAGPADKLDQAAEQTGRLLDRAGQLAAEKDAQAKALRDAAAEKDRQADALRQAAAGQPPDAADATRAASDAAKAEAEGLRQAADRAAAEADALRNAVKQSGGDALPQDLRRAADELRQNKRGNSDAARQSAMDRLDKLADSLTEKPEESADELRKKQKAAFDDVAKLQDQQDELRKKAKQAAEISDPQKRAEELQKLAREQEKLRRQAEQLAQRLTRERQDRPADAVRRAAEQMDAAREELDQGRPPAEQQEEALDRLDEALKKLDQEKKEDQEQLSREKREQLMEQLKAIRDKQQAAIAEADRLSTAAAKAMRWERAQIGSLDDLGQNEKTLAQDLRSFAEKNLTDLPVFGRLASQSADAMDRASRYVGERRDDLLDTPPFDAESEKVNDQRVRKPMQTALRRLDQILDTLKEDPKKPDAQAGGGGQPGGGGGDMPPAGQQGGGIPPMAQLKALRAMQAEVNERTAQFAQDHPDPSKLTDDEKDELKELEQSQRDVAELFAKLADLIKQSQAAPEAP